MISDRQRQDDRRQARPHRSARCTTKWLREWLLLLLLSVSLLSPCGCARSRPIDVDHWQLPPWGQSSAAQLQSKAAAWESSLFARHIADEGVLLYRIENNAQGAERYVGYADQACWTGYLLAALSYHDACLSGEGEPASSSRPHSSLREVVERQRQVLAGIEFLHAVTGEPGLFARSIVPESELSRQPAVDDWKPAAIAGYYYRSEVSKDQYSGVILGLVAAATLSSDPGVRRRSGALLAEIGRHLLRGGYQLRRSEGRATEFGDLRPRILGVAIGVHSVLVWAALEGATQLGGLQGPTPWRAEVSRAIHPLHFELFSVRNLSNDVMASAGVLALSLLPHARAYRKQLRTAVVPFLRNFRGEGNALFCGVGAAWGVRDLQEEQLALRNLLSAPTDLTIVARPSSRYEDLDRRWMPDRKWRRRLLDALPLSERQPNSFCWKSSPYLPPRDADGTLVVSGVDLYFAYWLGRYYGWIPRPTDS